jgi:hypothetical protein
MPEFGYPVNRTIGYNAKTTRSIQLGHCAASVVGPRLEGSEMEGAGAIPSFAVGNNAGNVR